MRGEEQVYRASKAGWDGTSEVPYFPWELRFPEGRVALTDHVVQRAMQRFGLATPQEAEEFLFRHLFGASGARRRRGAVRYSSGSVQIVVVPEEWDGEPILRVVTTYKRSEQTLAYAQSKRSWRREKSDGG